MRRREFITIVGAATVAFPLAVRAQQPMPVIGFLNQDSADLIPQPLVGFRKGLAQTGFVINQNVAIEYRWADAHYDRLPGFASDLVNRKVAVITAPYSPATLAAKKATSTIPIVFMIGVDPVSAGLVASLNQPGTNLTGLSNFNTRLMAKRLELMHQIAPRSGTIAVLVNSKTPATEANEKEVSSAGEALGLRVKILSAATEEEIDKVFVAAGEQKVGALLVSGDSYFNSRHMQIATLAARHKIPAIYDRREITMAGGLMSYGMNYFDFYRQAGIYTGQVLKGANPADSAKASITGTILSTQTASGTSARTSPLRPRLRSRRIRNS